MYSNISRGFKKQLSSSELLLACLASFDGHLFIAAMKVWTEQSHNYLNTVFLNRIQTQRSALVDFTSQYVCVQGEIFPVCVWYKTKMSAAVSLCVSLFVCVCVCSVYSFINGALSAWRHQIGQNISAHIREDAHSVIVFSSVITPSSLNNSNRLPKTHLGITWCGTGIHINTLYCTFSITFYKICLFCHCTNVVLQNQSMICVQRVSFIDLGLKMLYKTYKYFRRIW